MPLQRARRWLGYRIDLNDLLADAAEILDRFEASEIPLEDSFGSSSDPPERPRSTILFFGPGTEPQRLLELLELLEGIPIHYLHAGTESHSRKCILIGSYNGDADPVAPLGAELLEEIRGAGTAEELTEIVRRSSNVRALTIRS